MAEGPRAQGGKVSPEQRAVGLRQLKRLRELAERRAERERQALALQVQLRQREWQEAECARLLAVQRQQDERRQLRERAARGALSAYQLLAAGAHAARLSAHSEQAARTVDQRELARAKAEAGLQQARHRWWTERHRVQQLETLRQDVRKQLALAAELRTECEADDQPPPHRTKPPGEKA